MLKEALFVLSCTEDGDHYFEEISEDDLLDRLRTEYYGERKFKDSSKGIYDLAAYCGVILIRGSIIVPQPKQKIIEWEVPK